ncbi:MAG TPA: outer membrane beta-barrel protein, partial [Polyangiaceae bacterium]|nr:outer membrane beta-barrel protein [Polyangiaceae bacterium]
FGAQIMIKPADQFIAYLGYVGGPETTDVTAMGADVPDANSNWRHMIDVVADINPTKDLRFLFNFDYRTESGLTTMGVMGTHNASVYGGNLVARYNFSDAFNAAVRGEYLHDEHGDVLAQGNLEDFTLSLNYAIGTHLAFMFDNRLDIAENAIFAENTPGATMKSQFTTTLGVIASTK